MKTDRPSKPTILVVDGRPQDYHALEWLAVGQGAEVSWLTSGRDALRVSREKKAALWVISVELPDISGLDLYEMLRDRLEGIPVCMVGATYSAEEERRGLEAGATMYACKPVEASWLRRCLEGAGIAPHQVPAAGSCANRRPPLDHGGQQGRLARPPPDGTKPAQRPESRRIGRFRQPRARTPKGDRKGLRPNQSTHTPQHHPYKEFMMKASCLRWILPAGAAALLFAVPVDRAAAVSVHTHSHAHDRAFVQTIIDNDVGLFSAWGNAPSTTPGAHAHAWGSATVKFFGVRKRVGGHYWFTDDLSPKHAWWHARASTGQFILEGPDGPAELLFRVPASADIPEFEDDPGDPIPNFPFGPHPINGMFADSFFDVFVDLDVELVQDGTSQKVLGGSARLAGPGNETPGLHATRDLAGYLRAEQVSDARYEAVVAAPVFRSVMVEANKPFEARFLLATYAGMPPGTDLSAEHMHEDTPLMDIPDGLRLGVASSYVVDMFVPEGDRDRYRLIAVPEPAAVALLASGLAAGAFALWRRRKAGRRDRGYRPA